MFFPTSPDDLGLPWASSASFCSKRRSDFLPCQTAGRKNGELPLMCNSPSLLQSCESCKSSVVNAFLNGKRRALRMPSSSPVPGKEGQISDSSLEAKRR
jgi:hypothetical protein